MKDSWQRKKITIFTPLHALDLETWYKVTAQEQAEKISGLAYRKCWKKILKTATGMNMVNIYTYCIYIKYWTLITKKLNNQTW